MITTPTISIALVGCSSQKLVEPAPARAFYISPLFRSALALAEARHDVVYVVSAKHELVTLDQVIAPYDLSMSAVAKEWRAVWGTRVWGSILKRHWGFDRQIFIYAGKDYARPIRRAGFNSATFHEPLARLQLGQRLQWLREQLEQQKRENDEHGAASCASCGGEHCPHYACTVTGGTGYCDNCTGD